MLIELMLSAAASLAWLHHPHDVVNAVALAPGFPEDATVFCASAGTMNLFLVSHDAGFSWINARGGMRGWQVRDLAVAPDWETSSTAFAALGDDGLQRTRDGGQTWGEPLVDAPVELVVCGPVTAGRRTLFFAGEEVLWRSDDDGETSAGVFRGERPILDLALSPDFARDGTLAVTTLDYGVHLSRDGGASWSSARLGGLGKGLCFSPDFAADRTLWVATFPGGLFVSRDGGESFERVQGLEAVQLNDVVVSPDWPASRHLFVSTVSDGVFRSTDGGASWSACGLRIALSDQNWNHYLRLAISPAYPRDPTVYCAAFEGLYLSRDGGENWLESIIDSTNVGRHVSFSPGYERDRSAVALYYGNPCMLTEDAGVTWAIRSRGLQSMSTYSVALSPQFERDGLVFLGVERGLRRSADRGRSWTQVALEPAGERVPGWAYEVREILFSPGFASDREVLAQSEAGLFRSSDAGLTFTRYDVPEERPRRLAISPDWPADRTLFAGGEHLRRSDDGGLTWSDPLVAGEIVSMRCAPDFADSGEVFALSRALGFFASRDGGRTFERRPEALEGFSPSKLCLSPDFARDGTLWVATLSGGLRVSRDRGRSFEPLLPLGSPLDTCFDLDLSPAFARDRTALACTFEGLLRTTDGGASWSPASDRALYDDQRDPWLLRGPGWQAQSWAEGFLFGQHRAEQAGSRAVLPFAGTGILLYGSRGPDHGQAELRIDGRRVAELDAWASEPEAGALLWSSAELPAAFHNLTVEVLGRRGEASSGDWIGIDAAEVVGVRSGAGRLPVTARLEDLWLGPDASYGRDVTPPRRAGDAAGVAEGGAAAWRPVLFVLVAAALVGLWLRGRRAPAA